MDVPLPFPWQVTNEIIGITVHDLIRKYDLEMDHVNEANKAGQIAVANAWRHEALKTAEQVLLLVKAKSDTD